VEFEDRLTIATPEGVDLELPLAGLGSRAAAALIDRAIQLAAVMGLSLALILPFVAAGVDVGAPVGLAAFFILYFIVEFGYHVAFLTVWSGRTPGKRALGLRVLRDDGLALRFREAAVRSLVLLLDGPLTSYALGTIAILLSPRGQRVGDLVAGTVVARERVGGRPHASVGATRGVELPDPLPTWDVSGVSDADLAAMRLFLERRESIDPEARHRLATDLAARVREVVVSFGEPADDESFIEAVVSIKSARR